MIRATLRRAATVVALGETWAADCGNAPAARITVIPNAVRPASSIQPAPGESVGVVFLGSIGDHKGAFRLLDAWARLGPDAATLTIAGDGEVERARQRIGNFLGRYRRGARMAVGERRRRPAPPFASVVLPSLTKVSRWRCWRRCPGAYASSPATSADCRK